MRDPLADHPDRRRWNARYDGQAQSFEPHDLAAAAAALTPPDGPVLELACGPSGSALAAAAAGRHVTAVDVSDVALRLLRAEAGRRGLLGRIDIVHADLVTWRPAAAQYALVQSEARVEAAKKVFSGGLPRATWWSDSNIRILPSDHFCECQIHCTSLSDIRSPGIASGR